MALLELCVPFEDITLAVGSWHTLLAFRAPSNQMLDIRSVKLAGLGVAGDAKPIRFRFERMTASTGTAAATITPFRVRTYQTATPQGVYRRDFGGGGNEPTALGTPEIFYPDKFHPQGGLIQAFFNTRLEVEKAHEVMLRMFVESGQTGIAVTGHVIVVE